MTVVVDVGCSRWGADESMLKLIRRFHPTTYYGFDAQPTLEEGDFPVRTSDGSPYGATLTWHTHAVISRQAAWTYDGECQFVFDGIRSHVTDDASEGESDPVECFDLNAFLGSLADDQIVLKLDVEGGEYVLMRRLHENGLDKILDLVLVEWHGPPLDLPYRCPVELWQ